MLHGFHRHPFHAIRRRMRWAGRGFGIPGPWMGWRYQYRRRGPCCCLLFALPLFVLPLVVMAYIVL